MVRNKVWRYPDFNQETWGTENTLATSTVVPCEGNDVPVQADLLPLGRNYQNGGNRIIKEQVVWWANWT